MAASAGFTECITFCIGACAAMRYSPNRPSFLKRTAIPSVATCTSTFMVRTNTRMGQFNGCNSHGDYGSMGITAIKKTGTLYVAEPDLSLDRGVA
jgi:hypothetical protein